MWRKKIGLKSPKLHTQGPPGTCQGGLREYARPPKTAKNRGILILRAHVSPHLGAEAWAQVVVALDQFFFFFLFKDVEKKMELKSPKLHTPREVGTCHPPLTKIWESRYLEPQPHPAMWLRRGPGCRRPSNP